MILIDTNLIKECKENEDESKIFITTIILNYNYNLPKIY